MLSLYIPARFFLLMSTKIIATKATRKTPATVTPMIVPVCPFVVDDESGVDGDDDEPEEEPLLLELELPEGLKLGVLCAFSLDGEA